MKAKSFFFLALAFLLASCASVPEPSEKTTALVYGNVKSVFNWRSNNYGIPENFETEKNITVKVKNTRTGKVYKLSANNNGEIMSAMLPKGNYLLYKISAKVSVNARDWEFEDEFGEDADFRVIDGVTNLGKISYNIDYQSDNGSTWYYHYSTSWGFDPQLAHRKFEILHPDSQWNSALWRLRNGEGE